MPGCLCSLQSTSLSLFLENNCRGAPATGAGASSGGGSLDTIHTSLARAPKPWEREREKEVWRSTSIRHLALASSPFCCLTGVPYLTDRWLDRQDSTPPGRPLLAWGQSCHMPPRIRGSPPDPFPADKRNCLISGKCKRLLKIFITVSHSLENTFIWEVPDSACLVPDCRKPHL